MTRSREFRMRAVRLLVLLPILTLAYLLTSPIEAANDLAAYLNVTLGAWILFVGTWLIEAVYFLDLLFVREKPTPRMFRSKPKSRETSFPFKLLDWSLFSWLGIITTLSVMDWIYR